MWRTLTVLSLFLVLVGCGKNDNFYQNGFQAPNPYGPQYPGGGGFPQPGGPGYPPSGGGFQPQLPPGQGPGYTPFLPVDQYMRQDPYRYQQWQQLWGQWTQYCQTYGVNPYQFQHFWYDYCPYQYQYQMPGWYQHFNNTYYGWMGAQYSQHPQQYSGDPSQYWQYYQGLPLYWQ